jgi:quercetin dioxygenase-like cupin family protein
LSEREIVCADLTRAIDDLGRDGFRLEFVYPAEEPHTAVLANGAERVRVTTAPDAPRPSEGLPAFEPEFVLTRAGASPAEGRAGMLYRDLIPGRLGGRYIASHITVTQGGPVADWVHFHRIALQIITVRRGWVRVVYEDQGEPFVMREGDLVLQPPEIRHRVLEASDGLEVIEVGAPALHATFAEHDLDLPNGSNPARIFGGQHFLRHVAAETRWAPFHGGEAQETAIVQATRGLSEVRTVRTGGAASIDFPAHDGELVFGVVLDGTAELGDHEIGPADAFVIPPGEEWRLAALSPEFRLLHVTTARLD